VTSVRGITERTATIVTIADISNRTGLLRSRPVLGVDRVYDGWN
jgi:hypothetical protein